MKYLILFLLSFSAHADIYIDLSAEIHDEKKDSFYQGNGEPIKNFIGSVELSYEFSEGKSIFLRHSSSVQQQDTGLNTIGIKVRIF